MSKELDEIIRFQTDRDLDKKDFIDINENASIVEELLESIGLDVPKANRPQLKLSWERFVSDVQLEGTAHIHPSLFTDNDKADAYCDMVVFAIGALLKLGYDPKAALIEAGKEINSREGSMVDGKFEKDLSDAAQAKWYKADYDKAKRV